MPLKALRLVADDVALLIALIIDGLIALVYDYQQQSASALTAPGTRSWRYSARGHRRDDTDSRCIIITREGRDRYRRAPPHCGCRERYAVAIDFERGPAVVSRACHGQSCAAHYL